MFKTVAIAGTFDRLHKGHRFFISEAFKLGDKVIIGLTSDKYVEEKFKVPACQSLALAGRQSSKFKSKAESDKDTWKVAEGLLPGGGIKIQDYETREKELREFLQEKKLLHRVQIVEIDDVYGPASRRAGRQKDEIEALVVTLETVEGGRLVNQKRKELKLKQLKIIKVPLIPAEDRKRIASTRIRLGEIDRWGRVYYKSSKLKVGAPWPSSKPK